MQFRPLRLVIGAFATALLAAACSDATAPEPNPPGPDPAQPARLEAADSLVFDAIADTVRLTADIVDTRGGRARADAAQWSGGASAIATVTGTGLVRSVGPGQTQVVVRSAGFADTVTVVVDPSGVLTITFDDGWKSAHDIALPVLRDAGLRGNIGVVTASLTWPAFLDRTQMQALHDAGWGFVSHTVTHDSLPSLPIDSLRMQLEDSRAWLLDSGLRMGDVFIVPYHEWGPRERAEVERVYAAARGEAHDLYGPTRFARWRPADPYGITSIDGAGLSRTPEGRDSAMVLVEQAIEEGKIADLLFHNILPEHVEGFEALMARVAGVKDRVRTWDELFPVAR